MKFAVLAAGVARFLPRLFQRPINLRSSACWTAMLVLLATAVLPLAAQDRPGLRHLTDHSAHQADLRGFVTSAGQPVNGAAVEVQNMESGAAVASTVTGKDGRFSFNGLTTGEYLLVASVGSQRAANQVEVEPLGRDVEVRFGSDVAAAQPTVSAKSLAIPDKAQHLYEDAQHALQQHDLDQVQAKLAEALQIVPAFPKALTLRAALRLARGDAFDAIDDLDHAIRIDPNDPSSYFLMGTAMNMASRFDDAQRAASNGLRLNPQAWQGHYELAKALLGKGALQESLREFDVTRLSAPPELADLHLLRANALLRLHQFTECESELEQFLKVQPNGELSAQVRRKLDQLRAQTSQVAGNGITP